jgi:hypothetical protein
MARSSAFAPRVPAATRSFSADAEDAVQVSVVHFFFSCFWVVVFWGGFFRPQKHRYWTHSPVQGAANADELCCCDSLLFLFTLFRTCIASLRFIFYVCAVFACDFGFFGSFFSKLKCICFFTGCRRPGWRCRRPLRAT